MTVEIPLEISQLSIKLREMFTGKLAEAPFTDVGKREDFFLSGSLAAYAIHKLSGCSVETAAQSVVDGRGDGGIDAILFLPSTGELWVAQSKFKKNGRGQPSYDEVLLFVKNGVFNVARGNFKFFKDNELWAEKIPQLEEIFEQVKCVRPILVYSGDNNVSEDRLRLFDDLRQQFRFHGDNYIAFETCPLSKIRDWLIGADIGLGVPQVGLKLLMPSLLKGNYPYETIFGLLPLKDLAHLYEQYGEKLVAANIRSYKGSTEVNDQILTTIENESENFFYLNNGLTAYCEKFEINKRDLIECDEKRITAYGLSIVNGAQTLGTVAAYFRNKKGLTSELEGNVFIKIISLEKCKDRRLFAERITRSTNFQNQIGLKDFVALDERQRRIASQLQLSGITYYYRDGRSRNSTISLPIKNFFTSQENFFTLREATTTLACLSPSNRDEFCALIVKDIDSLWSMEEVYSSGERSRYARIFHSSELSARTVWRAVQTQKIVVKVMRNNVTTETGVRKEFFKHARWVILSVIFIRLCPQYGNNLNLTSNETSEITQRTADFAEELWSLCEAQGYVSRRLSLGGTQIYESPRHFRSVFSDASECERLRKGLLARLAQV